MKRITIAVLGLVVGTATGCKDMGLEGNVPLEEARTRPPMPLVVAVMSPLEAASERLVVDGRLWVPSGMPLTLQESDVRAVGSATGRTVYARRWDESPYDALFIRQEESAGAPGGGASASGAGVAARIAATTGGTTGGGAWIELRPVRGRSGPVPAEGAGATAGHGRPAAGGEHGGH